MALHEFASVIVAIVTFALGFALSRYVDRDNDKKNRVRESVKAIIPLLSSWQHKLTDLVQSAKVHGLKSTEYQQALDEFYRARNVAIELEMHVAILRNYGSCEILVEKVEGLFGSPWGRIDNNVAMYIRHGAHQGLVQKVLEEDVKSQDSLGTDWRIDAMVNSFDQWSHEVQLECVTVLSKA